MCFKPDVGIGHPITSGSSAIDFNIIATPMINNFKDVTHRTTNDIYSFGPSTHLYTEQTVLLDSIGNMEVFFFKKVVIF